MKDPVNQVFISNNEKHFLLITQDYFVLKSTDVNHDAAKFEMPTKGDEEINNMIKEVEQITRNRAMASRSATNKTNTVILGAIDDSGRFAVLTFPDQLFLYFYDLQQQ